MTKLWFKLIMSASKTTAVNRENFFRGLSAPLLPDLEVGERIAFVGWQIKFGFRCHVADAIKMRRWLMEDYSTSSQEDSLIGMYRSFSSID